MAIPPIDLLLERAEETGCLTLSELSELVGFPLDGDG